MATDSNLTLGESYACALLPPFGWAVALANRRLGGGRGALQALALSLVLPLWAALMLWLSGPLYSDGYQLDSPSGPITRLLFGAGVLGLPALPRAALARLSFP